MRLKLVEKKFLKFTPPQPVKKIDFSHYKNFFVSFIVVTVFYYVYNYVKTLPIKNPDLSCLPKNIRGVSFFKNIEGKKIIEKRSLNPLLAACNEDELSIKFSSI